MKARPLSQSSRRRTALRVARVRATIERSIPLRKAKKQRQAQESRQWYRPVQFRPERTKHPIGASNAVKRQIRRMNQHAATVEMYRGAIARVLARGGLSQRDVGSLLGWSDGLAICGDTFRVYHCAKHRKATVISPCCHLAMCPREQRRRSQRWCARGAALVKMLPNEPRGKDFKGVVGLTKGALGEETTDITDHTWKAIEVGLRQEGTVAERLDAHVELRAKLMRLLRRRYRMMAGFGSIEMGPTGNIHLHIVAYCAYLPREDMQRWLRSQDCTVPHCAHTPDDRCAACKREKRSPCRHPRVTSRTTLTRAADGKMRKLRVRDRRPRCNGSWYVDVRKCYVRDEMIGYGDPVTGGIVEAIKYAAAPVGSKPGKPGQRGHDAPTPGEAPTESQLAYGEELVRFFLALRDRKRVETYGLAREPDPHEENGVDDREPDAEGGIPLCPECGQKMKYAATGERWGGRWNMYEVFRERFTPRAQAP